MGTAGNNVTVRAVVFPGLNPDGSVEVKHRLRAESGRQYCRSQACLFVGYRVSIFPDCDRNGIESTEAVGCTVYDAAITNLELSSWWRCDSDDDTARS